ncbi:50S ribosomal protein L6 [Buchnera aphidicola]|uniref:50S ribosomal protein L6 n=1 Tax=Buchnera aphidicola (Therioaphis trifolii) TaxID=1241884 RepID=A0A4D6YKN5_9GAMM|nr:50S ribosomal protein L6 [Buchnera aphidicola]QCI27321.1 50S ribosomal protein L6 [Buchnera aphidicola (Therioaphis trifolii)]
MSRIAKKPILVPDNINISLNKENITIIKDNQSISQNIHNSVQINYNDNKLFFKSKSNNYNGWMHAGTMRSLVNSMILGVTIGFSKKLQLIGVGYRISLEKNNVLNMSLGYSHIIKYVLPINVFATIISSTEIILKSINKQLLGQVAANLRSKRKPEVYKGKGIRYFNEYIRIKEAKKK